MPIGYSVAAHGDADAAAIAAIDKCAAVAGNIGARVTAIAVEHEVAVRPNVTISCDLENMAAAEAVRGVSNAHDLLQAFDAAANRFGVRNEQSLGRLAVADIAAHFAKSARLKDLSRVPVRAHDSQSEKLVEALIFESSRPILICPEEYAEVFEAYVKAKAIDLLVMGAYRHTRLNEIVWGGATKTVIGPPPCWVMMSRWVRPLPNQPH